MKQRGFVFVSIFWMLLGLSLSGLGIAGIVKEYWSGMGSAFFVLGFLRLFRLHRLNRDPAFRERAETEAKDERNRFLRGRAWAWAGYLFVIAAALSALILQILGEELLSTAAGFAVCLMILLYWGSYFILRRKY